MKILEHAYIYQVSVLLTVKLKKFKYLISKELNSSFGGRTLDICCGTGNFASLANGEYVGFDLNKSYIDYARNRFKNDKLKQFLISDVNDFDFKPKHYDNVLLIGALHHFSDKSSLKLLESINRTVKDKIIIADPAIETKNPVSNLLILLDRGKFIRSLKEQLDLISKKLDIVKHFTYYIGFAHLRIIVCQPKDF